jgi:prepilin-type N-terminal cleavage/methylation domain-containing protein
MIGREKGFTLIEMVLVIVLLGIIGATLIVSFGPGIQTFVGVDLRKEALQNARGAAHRMIKEIREAQSFSACAPCSPVNTLTFTNILNNGITFSWSGTAQDPLTRNGDTLSTNVDDFTVTFYAQDGAEPADETEIWRIRVDLKVRVGDQTVDLRSEVHPRNLG